MGRIAVARDITDLKRREECMAPTKTGDGWHDKHDDETKEHHDDWNDRKSDDDDDNLDYDNDVVETDSGGPRKSRDW